VSIRAKKEKKKERFFFSRETYTRDIIIELIIAKLIQSLSRSFSLQRERVLHKNICVFVCDCYLDW